MNEVKIIDWDELKDYNVDLEDLEDYMSLDDWEAFCEDVVNFILKNDSKYGELIFDFLDNHYLTEDFVRYMLTYNGYDIEDMDIESDTRNGYLTITVEEEEDYVE